MPQKILITGAGGCVGHYLMDHLLKDANYEIYLLLRSPEKVNYNIKDKNIHIIKDDFSNIQNHTEIINKMDVAIHMLADWGGTNGNYEYSKILFEALNNSNCKKILYFSTASIIGCDSKVNDIMGDIGTPYIRGKYKMYKEIQSSPIKEKIITIFPTWILGGDSQHPMSHAYNAIRDTKKWLWLMRYFSIDLKFHFIHAQDIAKMTYHLLKSDIKKGDYIFGNPAITADNFISDICSFFKIKKRTIINLNPEIVIKIAKLIRKDLSAWDRYCIENRSLEFNTVNCKSFSLSSNFDNVRAILCEVFGEV